MILNKSTLSAFCLLAVFGKTASAALVTSGHLNIPIPDTFEGVYLDLDTGAVGTAPFAGWDINPYFGGSEIASSASLQPLRVGPGNLDAIQNVAPGTPVGAGSTFFATGFGLSDTHVGNGAEQFLPNFIGHIAFRFTTNDDAGPYYGWLRLKVTANTSGAFVDAWAYENTGASTPVPEPSTGAALAAVAALVVVRARKRRAKP